MPKPEEVELLSLDTLGHGAAREKFQIALDRVLENILDPNTKATAKRQVRLVVDITPTDERGECVVVVRADAKLAPEREHGSTIFVGRKMGKAVATTYDPQQQQLGFDKVSQPRSLDDARPGAAAAASAS